MTVAVKAEWMPIETAPKDGTKIDLWVTEVHARYPDRNTGQRIADAWWGSTCYGRGNETDSSEQWVSYFYGTIDPVESEFGGGCRYPTHWMPLPPAP